MIPIRINRLVFAVTTVMLIAAADIGVETTDAVEPENKITVIHLSDKHNKLTVIFDIVDDSVEVTLPNGRQVKLPRAISISGVHYTDGKETFWEHHGEGTYWVGDKLTFRGKAKE
jgi:membrane-bound inhibitor of C-type lysozyme